MSTTERVIQYKPAGPVVRDFHRSDAFFRGIRGPIGSGKSTACVVEILRRAQQQAPSPDGIRRSRWAVIRNSYPELRTTTLRTWGDWCPANYGKLNYDAPIRHHIKTDELDLEILFLALDRDEDARKLLSLELTGAWLNEAREIPKTIVDALTGRVGRYPSKAMGGASWYGVIADTNAPDAESWWFKFAEQETPEGWAFFNQPAGDSPDAENVKNLPARYYERAASGKDEDWIKVYIRGEYGYIVEGRPVFPMYRDRTHVAVESLAPVEGAGLLVGVDFGLTPAAVIGQRLADGRWLILDEFCSEDCGIVRFAELFTAFIRTHYPDHDIEAGWGDPAGGARSANDEQTAFDILNRQTRWRWRPAPSNDFNLRREVVVGALNRMVDGSPGVLISPRCTMLRKGFMSGYHFKPVRSSNGTQYHETPAKNSFSHPHDALQYLILGGGGHDAVFNRTPRQRGDRIRMALGVDYNPLEAETGDRAPSPWSNERTMRQMREGRRTAQAAGVEYDHFE